MDGDKNKVSVDIYDLCSILNTVGFKVIDEEKSKQIRSCGRRIEITCNVSGKKVYLESTNNECFCWRHAVHDDVEKWEMSGTSGGVQTSKMESSITSWKELPKNMIDFVGNTMESLVDIVRGTNATTKGVGSLSYVELRQNKPNADSKLVTDNSIGQVSKSTFHINTGDSGRLEPDQESANMYRSLDTLTAKSVDPVLPEPGFLNDKRKRILRENTYTTSQSALDENVEIEIVRTRTSSPVPSAPKATLANILKAEELSTELVSLIKETKKLVEEGPNNPGLSPYSVMDVSKISQAWVPNVSLISRKSLPVKTGENASPNIKYQYQNVATGSNLKRGMSVSTCKISSSQPKPSTSQKTAGIKRSIPKKLSSIASISPTFGNKSKTLKISPILGNQVVGTYKSISDRMSLGGTSRDVEMKRKSSLYSHVQPTIPRYIKKPTT